MSRRRPTPKSSLPALASVQRVIFYVRDTERSARWYQKTLGIPIRFKEPGWVELETKGVTLCLHGGRNTGPSKDPNEVSFRVRDFDAVYLALQLREVPNLSEPHSPCPGVRCVSFKVDSAE